MKLTGEILNKICPAINISTANVIAGEINNVMPIYSMDMPLILCHVLPNLLVECQNFTRFSEGLNYQSIALQKLFMHSKPARITMAQTINYGRTATHPANQQMIANTIYGGEWGRINLGNTLVSDGWDFRGSGPLQCTGREEHQLFANFYNKKFGTNFTTYEIADKLRDKVNIEMGLHFTCWFFSVYKNIIPLIIADRFNDVVKAVNGGLNGIAERTVFYQRCKLYLK